MPTRPHGLVMRRQQKRRSRQAASKIQNQSRTKGKNGNAAKFGGNDK